MRDEKMIRMVTDRVRSYQMKSWSEIIILSLFNDLNDIYHYHNTKWALGNAFPPLLMQYLVNYLIKCQISGISVRDSETRLSEQNTNKMGWLCLLFIYITQIYYLRHFNRSFSLNINDFSNIISIMSDVLCQWKCPYSFVNNELSSWHERGLYKDSHLPSPATN